MKGGSRYGAGRPGWHAKTTAALRLDSRQLARNGWLDPDDRTRTMTWESGSAITYAVQAESITLDYRFKFDDGWRDISQRIALERAPCHYGGSRLWFRCPRCRRRVALIYLRGWPGCRTCSRLVYPSQSEDAIDRSWRRTRKLEKKLSVTDGEWNYQRPKGMRQATYERLREAYWHEDQGRDDALTLFAARLGFEL